MATRNQVLIDIIGKYSNQGALQKFNADVGRSINNYKGLVGQVTNLNRTINIFGATIRQVGQGLQNLGTTMTAFVSLPVGAVLAAATGGLLEFDEQLIEIRKNAGLTFAVLDQVKDGLVALSRETPTALTGLGEIAAIAGRAGIADPGNILGFVKVIDQLSVATTLSVEESAKSIARLANIFYKPTESAKTYIEFLNSVGSAINELGQNIVGSEKEIVSATLRMAPSAAALNIPIQSVLGIAAALVETNTSAERTGTQANRALSELAANSVNIAKALGLNVEAFRDMIDSNPVEAFLATAEAIGSIESPTLRAMASEQLFGQIGGKVVNVLGELTEEGGKVYKTIALSNKAFEEGVSLQIEFERSLDAVSSQLKLVRNNLNVMAVSIGDVLLPIVSKLLSFAVPIIRMMADAFDKLDDRVKLAAVGFLLLAAVIGPLLFAVGSMMFSVGIITTGLTTAVAGLFGVIAAPIRFAAAIFGMITPMRAVIVVLGVLVGAMAVFSGSIPEILNQIASYVSAMYTWGASLFVSFADGMRSAMSGVVSIITQMLSFIAQFFESHSPPKAGPLKDMNKWGASVAQSFVDGFSKARMGSVLKFGGLIASSLETALRSVSGTSADVFNSIKNLVSSASTALGNKQGLEDEAVDSKTLKAMESVANAVMGIMQSGQAASEAIDGMRDSLGPFVDDFLYLIDAQKRYNSALEDLNKIREEQKSLDSNLQKEIERISALSGITAAERAAMIRAARMRKNARDKELEEQEKSAEAQVDATKKQVDEQESLISSLVDALKSSTAKKESESDLIDVGGFDVGKIGLSLQSARDELDKLFSGANEEGGRFTVMMAEADKVIRAFITGFKGDSIGSIADLFGEGGNGEIGPIGKAFLFGRKIKEEFDKVEGYYDQALVKAEEFKSNWNRIMSGQFDEVFGPGAEERITKVAKAIGITAAAILGLKFGVPLIGAVAGTIEWLAGVAATIGSEGILVGLFGAAGPVLGTMAAIVAALVLLYVGLKNMKPVMVPVTDGFALLAFWGSKITEWFKGGFAAGFAAMGGDMDRLGESLAVIWGAIKILGGVIAWVLMFVLELVVNVLGGVATVIAGTIGFIFGFLSAALDWVFAGIVFVGNALVSIWPYVVAVWSASIDFLARVWGGFVGWLAMIWDTFVTAFSDTLGAFKFDYGFLTEPWEALKQLWANLLPVLSLVWLVIQSVLLTAAGLLGGLFYVIWEGLKLIWAEVLVPLFSVLGGFITWVFKVIVSVVGMLLGFLATIVMAFLTVAGKVFTAIVNFFSWIVESIVGEWKNLEILGVMFEALRDMIFQVLDDLSGGMLTRMGGALDGLKGLFKKSGKDSSKSMSDGFEDGDPIGAMVSGVKSKVEASNTDETGGLFGFMKGLGSSSGLGFSQSLGSSDIQGVKTFAESVNGAMTTQGPLNNLPAWGSGQSGDFLSSLSSGEMSGIGGFNQSIADMMKGAPLSSVGEWGGTTSKGFVLRLSSADKAPVGLFAQGLSDNITTSPLSNLGSWGQSASGGLISGLSSADTAQVSEFAESIVKLLTDGIMSAVQRSTNRLIEVADAVAEIVANGFAMSTTSANGYMEAILSSSGLWVVRKAASLKSLGSMIAANILTGIQDTIINNMGMFDVISDTFASWKNLFFSGTNQIIDTAKYVGETIAQAIANAIASSFGEAMTSVASIGLIANGLAMALYTLAGQVRGAVGEGGRVYKAGYSLGLAIADAIGAGVNIGSIVAPGRSGDRLSLDTPVYDSGLSGGYDFVQNINLTITGDVIVDNEKRTKDLVTRVAYELGKNASTRHRMGGSSA
jgi:TP901 family phage tail tape measure protein